MPGGASAKQQKDSYSGKKKRRTEKAQVLIEQASGRIQATAFCTGKIHDFTLFKRSRTELSPQTECLADSGYSGLVKQHANSRLPHRSKLYPLTKEQKSEEQKAKNQRLASERYRSRRKRFGLRFDLIAALYNHELDD